VPLVLTSAAVAGAPGDPFAQGNNGAVPSPTFFAQQVFSYILRAFQTT